MPISLGPDFSPDAVRGDAASVDAAPGAVTLAAFDDSGPGDAASTASAPAPGQGAEEPSPAGTGVAAGARNVQYKGAPLDADRGPGLGCFWIQVVVLTAAVVVTPLSVVWGWPEAVSAALLFLVVLLLLLTGQTVIFLLRLVAADRRAAGRRRPLSSATRTVGELEDERTGGDTTDSDDGPPDGRGPVRQ
jgi:hypothetical protein